MSMWRMAGRAFLRLGRDESGVAMVVTLAVFMLMYVMCMGVYAVGTTVREKIQLQNAADAASYSAAVIQADTLSRIATINRAMAWTYVQMSRRQMDFIVAKWLRRSEQIYTEDFKKVEQWHLNVLKKGMSFSVPPACSLGHGTKGARPDKYWCGINEDNIETIWLNGLPPDCQDLPLIGKVVGAVQDLPGISELGFGRAVEMATVRKKLDRFEKFYLKAMLPFSGDYVGLVSGTDALGNQILLDKLTIKAMNLAEIALVSRLKGRITACVPNILRANLPEDDIEADRIVYRVEQGNPFTYFRTLTNTREDEQYFCSFAGYSGSMDKIFHGDEHTLQGLLTDPDGSVSSAFNRMVEKFSGLHATSGTDRWFVRGNGSRRARNSDFGIQRSYKLWPEDVIADKLKLHHAKYARVDIGKVPIFLPPSCFNFNGPDNEASSITHYSWKDSKENGLPSIGLYAQWQWYGMSFFCYPVWFIIYFEIHNSVLPVLPIGKYKMQHGKLLDFNLTTDNCRNCIYLPGKVVPFWYKTYRWGKWGKIRKRWRSSSGSMTTDFGFPGMRGYTRVYGDDDYILRSHREKYIGEKCMPLLLTPLYFGGQGTITVGVARRNENVWSRLLGRMADTMANDAFAAFRPAVAWSWAFSSAKAGYKDPDAPRSDSYIVDWRDADWKKWNLYRSDFDAVHVPVQQAKNQAYNRIWQDWTFLGSSFLEKWILGARSWEPLKETGEALAQDTWQKVAPPPYLHCGDKDGDEGLDWSAVQKLIVH